MLPVVESKELACTVGYEFSVVLVNLWFIILLCLAML